MTRRRPAAYLTPKMLGLHLLAIVLTSAMVVLGGWQLDAYDQRQDLDAAATARAEPVPLDSLLGPDQAFTAEAHARPVVVEGEYAGRQILVDRRGGNAPWVVAPLVTETGSAILVVRGVAEPGADRASSPDLPEPPQGRVRVTGSLQPSQARATDPNPRDSVVPSLSTAQLVDEFGTDLYSGFVVLTDQRPPSTLTRATPPQAEASFGAGLRNLMYALQWWVFAAFVLFMWWRIVRDQAETDRVA